jgi:hypothetical protein
MELMLILWMIVAAFGAVSIYTFIGFIPGTDETSVLLPISLALVLTGVDPMIILTFFIASIVTLNLTNTMPTALVGLPGGVMSSPMVEHAIVIKNLGKSAEIIKKMATASALGVIISVPLSLLVANILTPFADIVSPYTSYIFIGGAIFLSLISKHKLVSLFSIIPLALLFQSLRSLYWQVGVVPESVNVTVSFFLGITVGPLLFSLFGLLNKDLYKNSLVDKYKEITIPKGLNEKNTLKPSEILSKSERNSAGIGAFVSNFLFMLSPVGLTILIGNAIGDREQEKEARASKSIITMSAIVQATYLSGIIIPLLALGIPLSPVAIGPGAALFNAEPVFSLDNNIHHLLSFFEFSFATILGASIAVVISYFLINRYARNITSFIMRYIPHESVLALFIAFIVLLAFMDAGLMNVFGVLLVGFIAGTFHQFGVNYGVQFMALYAAPYLATFLAGI